MEELKELNENMVVRTQAALPETMRLARPQKRLWNACSTHRTPR